MSSRQTASRGALGGSANERGAELRARVGALLATAVIRNEPLPDIGLEIGAPHPAKLIRAEGDDPVDDLVVALDDGRRVFVQVKLTAGLTTNARTPFGQAVAQFIAAVRTALRPPDAVVLACAKTSRPLEDLATVLDRERLLDPGARTQQEQQAIDLFWEAARRQGATRTEFGEVCKRLTIWKTDPTTGDAAAALIARLAGVVAPGAGTSGASALADAIRELARRRGGLDGIGLVRALSQRKVPLAAGGNATGTVAMARALDDYKRRVVKVARSLRLIGVRGELGELPFERADAKIEVKVADEERPWPRELEHAFRRRGRVVLEGAPGGGKSTALRTLGSLAASREDWPVPIRVHLQKLATTTDSLTKASIDAATEDLPTPEATALAGTLERELAAGNVLLLLDGLDEVRRGRPALIERLVGWLGSLHPACEIVIATRPSAASDAAPLDFPVLRLQPPDNPRALVEAILESVHPKSTGDEWVDARSAWVDAAFERDPQLTATPLSVVVLTLIATRSRDPSTLPTIRARLLQRALEDIVSGWEFDYRHQGAATVGPLEGSRAEEAFMIAFRVMGCATVLAEPPTRDAAERGVAERLRDEFRLTPADARAAARDAIAFWDEAGLISYDAGVLRLTLRPFGELAAAWDVTLREERRRRAWVAEARQLGDLWETLALAGALAPDMAEEWAAGLKHDGEESELAAFVAALRDGMRLDQRVIDAVATGAGERLLSDPDAAEATVRTLVRMPLTREAKARLRPQLSARARHDRALLIEALATAHWDEHDPEADERLRVCITEGREEPPELPPPEPNVLTFPEHDSLYREAFEAAAARLAGRSRADAELVTDAFDDGSFKFIQELRRTLRETGHGDLADSIDEKLNLGRTFASWKHEDFEAAERRLMGWAAALAEPAPLEQRQRRRLDELADLFETAALNWVRPSWTEKHAALAEGWIRIGALLAGLDPGVIAAQARIVLDDMAAGRGTERLAYDNGREIPLRRWDRVDDPQSALSRLVAMLGVSSHEVTLTIGQAILHAPAELDAVSMLETRVPILLNWSRWYASRLIVVLAPDGDTRASTLTESDDPIMRSVGAWYLAARYLETSGRVGSEAFACVEDPYENVREAIVTGFALVEDKLDERAKAALVAMRTAPRQPWICRHCGAPNPKEPHPGCVSCSTSGPSLVAAVDELLGDRPRKPYRFQSRRRGVRRH